MHQGDRWKIGAFFGAYLQLNLQMVQGGFLGITVASAGVLLFMAAQLSSSVSAMIFFSSFVSVLTSLLSLACAAGVFVGVMHVMIKLDSQTLYQKSAYLYQSIPVSAFETALAKTAVGAVAMMIPVILCLLTILCMAAYDETSALDLFRQMEKAGLPLEYPAASMLLIVLSLLSGSMTASGIVLLGFGLGNQLASEKYARSGRHGCIGNSLCSIRFSDLPVATSQYLDTGTKVYSIGKLHRNSGICRKKVRKSISANKKGRQSILI